MKKQKILFLVLALITIFSNLITVYASDELLGHVVGDSVRIRTSMDTSGTSNIITELYSGDTVNVIDTNAGSTSSCSRWYKIIYNGSNAYICGDYVLITSGSDNFDYEEQLAKFPDSYKSYIQNLHTFYPSAIFVPHIININFDSVVSGQNTSSGLSLLYDVNRSRDGLKSIESWSYNYYTNVFSTSFIGGGSVWYAASKSSIAYYLDPRNSLTYNHVFQFLNQSYVAGMYTEASVNSALSGTFMYNATTNDGIHTFAQAFIDAGISSGVSPYVLISRVIQEIGTTRSTIVSGTYPGYEGYYNYYNINASGSNHDETMTNGLIHAKSKEWTNDYLAIVGGASFLSNNYISIGQNTTYLQKFDITNAAGTGLYTHQYMQNVEAPRSEAIKLYTTYKNNGLTNASLIFSIPVYNNMPSSPATLPNSGNPNNYLRDLTIDGVTISGFDGANTSYSVNVSDLQYSVNIAATKVASTASVSGLGSYSLTGTSTNIPIIVTAANGDVKTYNITITKNADIAISIGALLNGMSVKSNSTNISGLAIGVTGTDFVDMAKNIDTKASVTITNSAGNPKTGTLGTGDKIKIISGSEEKTFTIVIYGDLNGDGIVNSADLLKIRQHLIGSSILSGAYLEAANTSRSGSAPNSGDLLKLRQHLIGASSINQ